MFKSRTVGNPTGTNSQKKTIYVIESKPVYSPMIMAILPNKNIWLDVFLKIVLVFFFFENNSADKQEF